jgi:hypothetical protein
VVHGSVATISSGDVLGGAGEADREDGGAGGEVSWTNREPHTRYVPPPFMA